MSRSLSNEPSSEARTCHATTGGTQTQTLLGLNNPDLVLDGVPLFGVSLSVELETR